MTTARAGLEATTAKLRRTSTDATTERRRDLDRLLLALAAHDPQRTLERGYALVEDPSGAPLTTAAAALAAAEVRVRFADGTVDADVREAAPAGAAPAADGDAAIHDREAAPAGAAPAADGDAATHDREADAARARPGGAAFASLFTPTTEED